MAVALALAMKTLRFFHLITHALFKALLFICVGVGIHTVIGSQDFRSYRGFFPALPWPSALLCTANLALLRFPFLAGFYSNDSILERFYNRGDDPPPSSHPFGGRTHHRLQPKDNPHSTEDPRRGGPDRAKLGGDGDPPEAPRFVDWLGRGPRGRPLGPWVLRRRPGAGSRRRLLPLSLVAGGAPVGWALSRLKAGFLRRIWDLSPTYQALARGSEGMRALRVADEGAGEALRGPG